MFSMIAYLSPEPPVDLDDGEYHSQSRIIDIEEDHDHDEDDHHVEDLLVLGRGGHPGQPSPHMQTTSANA